MDELRVAQNAEVAQNPETENAVANNVIEVVQNADNAQRTEDPQNTGIGKFLCCSQQAKARVKTPKSGISAPDVFAKAPPRVLQFGINVIAIQEVDVANHTFTANIFCTYLWQPTKAEPFWRPWVQFHNIKDLTQIFNPKIHPLTDEELRTKAINGEKAEEKKNFIGVFMVPLELFEYPFDYQKLNIVVVFDPESDVLVTHRGAVTVKCNNEADVVSEWRVVRAKAEPHEEIRFSVEEAHTNADRNVEKRTVEYGSSGSLGTTLAGLIATAATNITISFWGLDRTRQKLWDFSGLKTDNHGLTVYRFDTQRPHQSGMGASYQRLEFFTVVSRKSSGTLWAVLVPNVLLSLSAMSCYALSFSQNYGERLNLLFVITLAIIANYFAVKERVPQVAYLTWLEKNLWWFQLFVYLQILFTSIIPAMVQRANPTLCAEEALFVVPQCLDLIAALDYQFAIISICLFAAVFGVLTLWSGIRAYHDRKVDIRFLRREYVASFWREEYRVIMRMNELIESWKMEHAVWEKEYHEYKEGTDDLAKKKAEKSFDAYGTACVKRVELMLEVYQFVLGNLMKRAEDLSKYAKPLSKLSNRSSNTNKSVRGTILWALWKMRSTMLWALSKIWKFIWDDLRSVIRFWIDNHRDHNLAEVMKEAREEAEYKVSKDQPLAEDAKLCNIESGGMSPNQLYYLHKSLELLLASEDALKFRNECEALFNPSLPPRPVSGANLASTLSQADTTRPDPNHTPPEQSPPGPCTLASRFEQFFSEWKPERVPQVVPDTPHASPRPRDPTDMKGEPKNSFTPVKLNGTPSTRNQVIKSATFDVKSELVEEQKSDESEPAKMKIESLKDIDIIKLYESRPAGQVRFLGGPKDLHAKKPNIMDVDHIENELGMVEAGLKRHTTQRKLKRWIQALVGLKSWICDSKTPSNGEDGAANVAAVTRDLNSGDAVEGVTLGVATGGGAVGAAAPIANSPAMTATS